jgi:predicted O-methyltransferase YrrM
MQNSLLAEQQGTWRLVERFRGRYDLPLEQALQLPDDPLVRVELDWLRALLRQRQPSRILEIGAGRGWASRALAADGHRVVATDLLDDPHIGLGSAVRQRLDFDCVLAGAERLPFLDHSFDCIFCFATVRHVVDLERVFQEISRVLRPGGLFVALHEPFRGSLTTQGQRFQDCFTYLLARWWLVGELPGSPSPDVLRIRNGLGSTIHEICRRASYCTAVARAAGLQATVLPTAYGLSLQPDLTAASDSSTWLQAFTAAYGLNGDRLRQWLMPSEENLRWRNDLLAHWLQVGNTDGILLAAKEDGTFSLPARQVPDDPEGCLKLDPMLLACSQHGLVPIYGLYPAEGEPQAAYHWMQPEAGFLIPGARALEVSFSCPARPYCLGPVRIELRLEAARPPLWVGVILPGKSFSARVPLPGHAHQRGSVLVRLTANVGFVPSDFHPGQSHDSRLLSLQLRSVRARP